MIPNNCLTIVSVVDGNLNPESFFNTASGKVYIWPGKRGKRGDERGQEGTRGDKRGTRGEKRDPKSPPLPPHTR